jgi:hypothetical protein
MKLALLAAFLALPMAMPAQSAKVVALSDADAKLAKSLYEQKAAVEAKIDALNKRIHEQSKWTMDFEYSEDFRFIVPKDAPTFRPNYAGILDCTTLTIKPTLTTAPGTFQ